LAGAPAQLGVPVVMGDCPRSRWRGSQPNGAVVPSQQLVRNLKAAQGYEKVKS